MNRARSSSGRRVCRWITAGLLILLTLFWPQPRALRWLRTAGGVRAATFVPNDFVLINGQFSAAPAILRFNLSGTPDPAPGVPAGSAIFLPGPAQSVAWGPDGNLYRINTFPGGVDSFNVDTNTLTPFVSTAVAQGGSGLAFGPDGNLYVGRAGSGFIDRYCGPLNTSCAPGTPLPSGQTGVTDPAFYALGKGFDIVFGPDGNLYQPGSSSGTIARFCGPVNTGCAPGAPDGLSGNPTDPTFVSLGTNVNAESLAFGPDGNLYVALLSSPGGINRADVVRFCGGPQNGSSCPEAMPDPAAGQTGALFVPQAGVSVLAGLDFGPDGNLYVNLGTQIKRYLGPNCTPAPCEGTPDGANPPSAVLVPFGTGGLSFSNFLKFPHAMVPVTPPPPAAVLLVGDQNANKVLRYDLATGSPFPASGQAGADFVPANSGGLLGTAGMVLGPDGNLYVGSGGSNSVLRFDPGTGAPIPAPGQLGADFVPAGSGGLSFPAGVVFGPDKNLYVASLGSGSVLRFDGKTGAPLPGPGQFGADFVPANSGGLRFPKGLVFGPDGNLYVAGLDPNPNTGTVLRFDGQTGAKIGVFVPTLRDAVGVVFGPDGNLYLDEGVGQIINGVPALDNTVKRFDGRTGNPMPAPGQSGADFVPDVGPFAPAGLAFGSDGNLYVTAPSLPFSGQVLRFDGTTGASLGPFVSAGLDVPVFLLSATAAKPAVTGTVFHDSVAPQNILPNATVEAAVPFGNLLACPFGGFFFQLCPNTTTDNSGNYVLTGLTPGQFVLTAFPPQTVPFFPNSIVVTLPAQPGPITGQDIVLVPPVPIPSGTTVTPTLGMVPVPGGNVPVVGWLSTFLLSTQGCPGGSAHFTMSLTTKVAVASGNMMEGPPGTYTASVGPLNPVKGLLNVLIAFQCPAGMITPTVTFQIYIDPSGTVVDDVTGQGIPGATVTLFRSDTAKGTFTQVPAGSAFMSLSNRNNPDQTNAAGQYGWDVAPGFYQLQASAPGFTCDQNNPPHGFTCVNGAVQSSVFAIPPAVTDLKLPLHHTIVNLPPVARIAPAVTPVECASHSGTQITLDGSASSDPDGDTLTFSWTQDGNPVGGNTSMLTVTVPLGAHAFALTVTDPGGLSNTATAQVMVQDTTPPTLTLSTTNIIVTLPTASATGATVSLAGIASATDTCDPNPSITNNAPANSFFPVGTTAVTFTATDHSGNSTQTQLTVRVVYKFTGYFTPILNDGSAFFHSGRTVPVKFQLTAADGTFVTNAVANIQVFFVLSTPTGTVDESVNTTASGSSNTGTLFRFDPTSNQYIYNLNTSGYATGMYLLRTTINDGTTHDVQFSVK